MKYRTLPTLYYYSDLAITSFTINGKPFFLSHKHNKKTRIVISINIISCQIPTTTFTKLTNPIEQRWPWNHLYTRWYPKHTPCPDSCFSSIEFPMRLWTMEHHDRGGIKQAAICRPINWIHCSDDVAFCSQEGGAGCTSSAVLRRGAFEGLASR